MFNDVSHNLKSKLSLFFNSKKYFQIFHDLIFVILILLYREYVSVVKIMENKLLEFFKYKYKRGFEISLHFKTHLEVLLNYMFREEYYRKESEKLVNKDFVIISNNCFGGQAYQRLKRPYNTPFVGMFLYGPCYLKLLQNFNFYLKQELIFITNSVYKEEVQVYPIALLYDIELHFLHYATQEEAMDKWCKRLERLKKQLNYDNLFFQISDRDLVDKKLIIEFHKLDFKNKLSFAAFDIEGLNNFQHVNVYKRYNTNKLNSPNGKKLFEISFLYLDFVKWINTKQIIRTRFKD